MNDDPLYDWRAELVTKAWPRLPLQRLVCGHRAPLWDEDHGYCRRCGKLVPARGDE